MPKRKTIEYYEEKIKKLKEKPKKRRRRVVHSSCSEDELNEDVEINEECTASVAPDHEITTYTEADEPIIAAPGPSVEQGLIPEQTPTQSPPEGQDLDPELLSALGDTTEDTPNFGENIHISLTQRWLPILKKGLLKESKTKLLNDYPIPENCKLLKAPTLNFEISAAVAEVVRNRDKSIQTKQDQLGHGITAISKAITLLLQSDDKINAIKILSDGCRILTDLHYTETELRTKLLTPCLQKSFISIIEKQDRDETLFGTNLSEKIKSSQTIERQDHQIKKSAWSNKTPTQAPTSSTIKTRHPENWQGPPRYPQSSRGGRGGLRRVAHTQYRRTAAIAAPTAPATATRPSTSYPPRRAPRQ